MIYLKPTSASGKLTVNRRYDAGTVVALLFPHRQPLSHTLVRRHNLQGLAILVRSLHGLVVRVWRLHDLVAGNGDFGSFSRQLARRAQFHAALGGLRRGPVFRLGHHHEEFKVVQMRYASSSLAGADADALVCTHIHA
jgi:hypothetical protein